MEFKSGFPTSYSCITMGYKKKIMEFLSSFHGGTTSIGQVSCAGIMPCLCVFVGRKLKDFSLSETP